MSSGRQLKELFVDGDWYSGIPIQCFDPGFLDYSIPFLPHVQQVFSSLESLHLNTYENVDHNSSDECIGMLKELNSYLVEIEHLKMLHLAFKGSNEDLRELPFVKLEKVFGIPCHIWSRLTHLKVFGMIARCEDLSSFLKAHPLKTLYTGKMGVVDGNWTIILAAMRLCLP